MDVEAPSLSQSSGPPANAAPSVDEPYLGQSVSELEATMKRLRTRDLALIYFAV